MDGFYAKERTAPELFISKTLEQWLHVVDSMLELTLYEIPFLDFNVKPEEGRMSAWPSALEAHRDWILVWTGRGTPFLCRILNGFISRHNRRAESPDRISMGFHIILLIPDHIDMK